MAVIRSMKDLKRIIEQRIELALCWTIAEMDEVFNKHIEAYYNEPVFRLTKNSPPRSEPIYYDRQDRFRESFRTEIVNNNGRFFVKVGLDEDYLRTFYAGSPDWGDRNYQATGQEVAEWANNGLHGGRVKGNIHFWDDAMEELGGRAGILALIKKNLKRVGVPTI